LKDNSDLLAVISHDGGAYLVNMNCDDLIESSHILRHHKEMRAENLCVPTDIKFGCGLTKDKLFVSHDQNNDRSFIIL
jgi:hypothetical protein